MHRFLQYAVIIAAIAIAWKIFNGDDDTATKQKRAIIGNQHIHKRQNQPSYNCPPTCTLPSCFCPSLSPPGELRPQDTPQFVLITFDDAITIQTNSLVAQFLNQPGLSNPDGCRIPLTFFAQTVYSDFSLVQQMYAQGHEIADHSMFHPNLATLPDPSGEILGQRLTMEKLAGIPKTEIRGFRAPFLSQSAKIYEILSKNGFEYDCSQTVGPGNFYWPFMLDNGSPIPCDADNHCIGNTPYPGLWSIPMNNLWDFTNDVPVASMDPDLPADKVLELFQNNFLHLYKGNRSPFGIWLHANWLLSDTSRVQTLAKFVNWAKQTAGDNVYFVTPRQLLKWVRNPVPLSQMRSWSAANCPNQQLKSGNETLCNGLDDNGNGQVDEGLLQSCVVEGPDPYNAGVNLWLSFSSCNGCPSSVPTPQNPTPPMKSSAPVPASSSTVFNSPPTSNPSGPSCNAPSSPTFCVQGSWSSQLCGCVCIGDSSTSGTLADRLNGYCIDSNGKCTLAKLWMNEGYYKCPDGSIGTRPKPVQSNATSASKNGTETGSGGNTGNDNSKNGKLSQSTVNGASMNSDDVGMWSYVVTVLTVMLGLCIC